MILVLFVPISIAKVIWRREVGLKSHPKDGCTKAAAFQLVLEAEEDADLPVSYMQNLI